MNGSTCMSLRSRESGHLLPHNGSMMCNLLIDVYRHETSCVYYGSLGVMPSTALPQNQRDGVLQIYYIRLE